MGTIRRGRLVLSLVVAALMLGALPAAAERIPSRVEDPAMSRPAELTSVSRIAAREDVARALAEHGLTREEVEARLARLSDADLHRLAANLEQVQAAGSVPNYVWIVLAAFLIVSTLAIGRVPGPSS